MLINFNHLKTFYNALVHKMNSSRGNWEQNDPTADDYIKNRTHYSEGIKDVTVLEYIVDTDTGSASPMDSAGPEIYHIFFDATDLQSFVVGQQYSVKWNNASYTCVAKMAEGLPVLGDVELTEGYEGSGEPFLIALNPKENFGIIMTTQAGKYPITVTTRQEVVHKLDKKFIDLPDNLVTDDALAEVAKSGSYYDLMDAPTIYTDAVRYNSTQSLTTTQKSTARNNIGAGTSNFSGSYNDLTNKTHSKNTKTVVMPYANDKWPAKTKANPGVDDLVCHDVTIGVSGVTSEVKNAVKSGNIHHLRMNGVDYNYRGTVTYVYTTGQAVGYYNKECTAAMLVFGNASLIAKYIDDIDGTISAMGGYEQFSDTGENLCYMIGVFDEYPYDAYLKPNVLYRMTINDTDTAISIPTNTVGYIYEYEALDEAYIPSTIARVGDSYTKEESDARYLIQSDAVQIIWKSATDVTDYVTPHSQRNVFYKITDEVFDISDLDGAYFIVDTGDGRTDKVDLNNVKEIQGGCSQGNAFCSIYDTIVNLGIASDGEPDTFPSTGTYLGMSRPYDVQIVIPKRIKKIDDKYLPNNLVTTSELSTAINNALGVIENGTY